MTATQFDAAAVAHIAERNGDSAWLKTKREEAFKAYESLDWPDTKENEDWRRTDLSRLDVTKIKPFVPAATVTDYASLPAAVKSHLGEEAPDNVLVQLDSSNVFGHLADDLKQQGVIFTDLATAAREHPELVEKYLGTAVKTDENRFTAMSLAFLAGGVFLYIPKNVEVKVPLQALIQADGQSVGVFNRTLIVADTNSSVTFIERYSSGEQDQPALHSGAVEVIALDGARVRFASLQEWGGHFQTFVVRRAHIGRDATVDWISGEFGASLTRADMYSHHVGQGANSKIYSVYVGSGREQMDVAAGQVHQASYSAGDILARTVLTDRAKAVYRGLGQIDDEAKQCETFQRSQALVLSDKARADAIPGLIIEETDVASGGHAATIGQVDKEQLFYLMARGLSRTAATLLMVDGFLAPLLEQLPLESVRDEIVTLVHRKIGA